MNEFKGSAILDAYLEPIPRSAMKPFCEDSYRPKAVRYFRKKATSQMLLSTCNVIKIRF